MFILFTPFTYIFLSLYLMLVSSLFFISNFVIFWIFIELSMLLFMGISYTVFVSGISYLIVYFLVQSVASFNILLFNTLCCPSLLFLSIILNLAMFPFFSWFIASAYRFPNSIFFISSTIHNLPPLLIVNLFYSGSINLWWYTALLTLLVSSFIIINSCDLRLLLVSSSVGNNAWMLLGILSSIESFIFYFLVYSIIFFLILVYFSAFTNNSTSWNLSSNSNTLYFSFLIVSMAGLPPLPLFFAKLGVIYSVFYSLNSSYLFTAFMFLVALISSSYVVNLINYFILNFSNPASLYIL